MNRWIKILVAFSLTLGCSGAKKKVAQEDEIKSSTSILKLEDSGPQIIPPTGAGATQDFGASAVVPLSVDTIDGFTYVKFQRPRKSSSNRSYMTLIPEPGVTGFVTYDAQFVIARFVGKKAPAKFSTLFVEYQSWGQRSGFTSRFDVTVPANAKKPATKTDLSIVFYKTLAADLRRTQTFRANSGFARFAEQRLQYLVTKAEPQRSGRPVAPRRPTDEAAIISRFSGASSIRETLQADRALWIRGEKTKPSIPIKDVTRLDLKQHPWPEMIAALKSGPKIEPLAKMIPADMAYIHFHDLRSFVKLVRELDGWVSPVSQQMERRRGARHFVSYYEKQLMLERSGVAEKIGHEAAHDVAITIGDVFVREGTDVSMIFRVKNQTLLDTALKAFEISHTTGRKDITRTTDKIDGVAIKHTASSTGDINQYRADYDGLTVISNSRGAIAELLKARKGKVTTLAESGDFQYMRSLQPFSEKGEDGFVFISDAFVIRSVSPELRILNARRFQAEADLFSVNYGMMLHALLGDGFPSSASKSPFLKSSDMKHANGAKIAFDPKSGASSSWGSVRMMKPLREMKIDKVSKEEADAYKRFVDGYQNYWSDLFDPIGIQIARTPDGKKMSFDVRILPLIENSEYGQLIRTVGDAHTKIRPIQNGIAYTLAIGKDAEIRRWAEFGSSSSLGVDLRFSWLGDWVQVGAADHSAIWDLAVLSGAMQTASKPELEDNMLSKTLKRAPLFVAVQIANQLALAATLTKLRQYVTDSAPGTIEWGPIDEPHRDIQIVSVQSKSKDDEEFGLYYAIVDDVFVVSFEKTYLKMQIDRVLDVPENGPEVQSALDVSMTNKSWLSKTLSTFFESVAFEVHETAGRDFRLLHNVFGSNVDPREHGLHFLGYEPRSPFDGTFSIDELGRSIHSQTGSLDKPMIPTVPLETSVGTTIESLSDVLGTISFTNGDNTPGLHANFSMTWK